MLAWSSVWVEAFNFGRKRQRYSRAFREAEYSKGGLQKVLNPGFVLESHFHACKDTFLRE